MTTKHYDQTTGTLSDSEIPTTNAPLIVTPNQAMLLRLTQLGIIGNIDVRSHHVGASDYSKHVIQPWSIDIDYNLNYWDGDIVKRTLRFKESQSRRMDYEKIIHICQERIRQIDSGLK